MFETRYTNTPEVKIPCRLAERLMMKNISPSVYLGGLIDTLH